MGDRMMVVFFILLAAMPLRGQDVLAHRVSVAWQGITADEALQRLIDSLQFNISYNSDLFRDDQILIDLVYRDTPLEVILQAILHGKNIGFKPIGRQIVLYPDHSDAPAVFTISGWVEDRHTGERLIGAHVMEMGRLKGVASNVYGFYSITLPAGTYTLMASYLGYTPERLTLTLDKNRNVPIYLVQDGQLAEVTVTALPDSVHRRHRDMGIPLDLQQMSTLPSLGGEPDLLRFAALQPGVMTGTDGFGGLHVRGGNADQNLFLLDGVPVYSPSHAAGMFSIFDSPAIRSAQLYKGGFPARYGGRLSSIFDVRTKEGNNRELKAEGSIGLVAAKVAVEGPIDPGSSSFFVSARRTIFDPWLKGLTQFVNQERGNSGFTSFRFYDVNGKMNFRSGEHHRFYISLYHGHDDFHQESGRSVELSGIRASDQSQNDLKWGNTLASFRWNWLLHPQWFVNATIYTSTFNFSLLDFYEFNRQDASGDVRRFDFLSFTSRIQDTGLRLEGEFHPERQHILRFGSSLVRHLFQPGALALDQNSVDAEVFVEGGRVGNLDALPSYSIIPAIQWDAYMEDQFLAHPYFSGNIGLYINAFFVNDAQYWSWQPRVQFNFHPSNRWLIQLSYGHMAQNLHLLTNSGMGLPGDLWVPATSRVRPLEARQYELAVGLELVPNLRLQTNIYHKTMDHLLAWRSGASFLPNGSIFQSAVSPDTWEESVTTGSGTSYGLEMSLIKEAGRWTGSIHYSLARTDHIFPEINDGRSFPFRYDRRHTLHIPQRLRLNPRFSVQAIWTWASGNPITIPIASHEVHSPYYVAPGYLYSDRNGFRLKPYHRLDITMRYVFAGKKTDQALDFGLYNAYNRLNPLYVRSRENIYNPAQRELVEVALIPVLPVVRYEIKLR
jgi:hypothetical protein